MLELSVNGESIPISQSRFPAGETLLRLKSVFGTSPYTSAAIELTFESNDDLFNLLLLVDAVKRAFSITHMSLTMPYVPYARQDRVCNPGESLSIKVVADLVNSCNFDQVIVRDVHSDVTLALFNNITHFTQATCAKSLNFYHNPESTILVIPDAGASKKVLDFAKQFDFKNIVRADKVRDSATGAILDTIVYSGHVGSKDFLILDDICDGGWTFTELEKKLRNLTVGGIYLYVTHGIFSKGIAPLACFDQIYVSNLKNYVQPEGVPFHASNITII